MAEDSNEIIRKKDLPNYCWVARTQIEDFDRARRIPEAYAAF